MADYPVTRVEECKLLKAFPNVRSEYSGTECKKLTVTEKEVANLESLIKVTVRPEDLVAVTVNLVVLAIPGGISLQENP